MSVDSTAISQQFTMDGQTANFTFTFAALQSEPESIKVRLLNTTNVNTYSTLTYDTDYTVVVNAEGSGGVITVVDSSPTDYLFAYRETADKQETNYTDFNQFPADTLEHDLDRRTLRSQEADNGVSRAVKFDVSSSISGITLPAPDDTKALKWSGTGGTLINSTYDPDESATLAASSATVAQAAEIQTNVYKISASASQIAAAASETAAGSHASVAGTYATLAISAANTALGANRTIDTLLVTTNAVIAIGSIGTLTVPTFADIAMANITGLTVGTVNITNMDSVTVDTMTVLTTANINTAIVGDLSATTATITNLTVDNLAITGIDTATMGELTITTSADIAMAIIEDGTAATLNVTTEATIEMGIIEDATVSTLVITTAATANMMDMAAATAGNLIVTTSATIANAAITELTATTINISAGTIDKEVNIEIANTASSTWTTQQHFNNLFGSTGRATGGFISSAGSDSIAVSAGTGFIKATDSDTDTLMAFNWGSAASITIATNTTTYVKVSYNSGVPTIGTTTTYGDWDLDTSFPIGSVVQEGGKCHILNDPWWVTDGTTNIIERLEAEGLERDDKVGGLILSVSDDRKTSVTAGKIWSKINEFDIPALASDSTIEVYWRTSSTLWTDTDVSTLSTVSYNDLTTNTLEPITNNRYVNWWAYAEADDLEIAFIYPQAEYVSAAGAEAEAPPSALPAHIAEHGILIGRVILQNGTETPIEVQTAFGSTFTAAQAADHGNLSGLGDDDHTQYVLASGTRTMATLTTPLLTATTVNIEGGTVTALTITTLDVTNINFDDIGDITAGSITILTNATIADIDITGGEATALTIADIQITGGQATALTITTLDVTTINMDNIGNITAGSLTVLTNATIADIDITGGEATALTINTLNVTTITSTAADVTINAVDDVIIQPTDDIILQPGDTTYNNGPFQAATLAVTTSCTLNTVSATTATITTLTATTINAGSISSIRDGDGGQVVAGHARIGFPDGGAADYGYFGHIDMFGDNNSYAMVQGASGDTWLNAASGQNMNLCLGGASNIYAFVSTAGLTSKGLFTTTSTITNLTATTITVGGNPILPNISKSLTIESAEAGDTITMFKVPSAATIQAMYSVVTGTSPSATWLIYHGTSRASGSPVNTAGTTETDTTSGSTITAMSDATIAANSWVWAYVSAVSGTVDTLNITIDYKVD